MSTLHPCTSCGRHVRAEETTCPFCNAVVHAAPVRPPLAAGRLTRAAIFAGAIGAMGACEKPPEAEEPRQLPAEVSDAGVAPAPAADAAPAVAAPPDASMEPTRRVRDPNMTPKPYGAPPARRRLV